MQTLRSLKDLKGYVLNAQDGEIGKCSDFLFDDQKWTIRYIVADTMKWLPGRKVLISPISVGDADGVTRRLNVGLTKDQIKSAPPLDADAPVSRQYEIALNKYYDWAHYWGGSAVWGTHHHPRMLINRPDDEQLVPEVSDGNSHLRSAREVTGYRIQATDSEIGHVEDFIVDEETWTTRYLVVDTKNWIPASKKVLVAPDWVEQVDWRRSRVLMDLSREQIESSPAYDPSLPVNRELEVRLYDFYGRPYYW